MFVRVSVLRPAGADPMPHSRARLGHRLIRPFRAFVFARTSLPRALPWAGAGTPQWGLSCRVAEVVRLRMAPTAVLASRPSVRSDLLQRVRKSHDRRRIEGRWRSVWFEAPGPHECGHFERVDGTSERPPYSVIASFTGWTKWGVFWLVVSSAAFLSACFRSLYSNSATRLSD